ncbi:MAG: hypothetical protein ABL883_03290 [Terricaulis sp.]
MSFERVHTIRDIYDGVRTGTADFGGSPHYFASLYGDRVDDYVDHFRLYRVNAQFMERELAHWAIFRAWEAKFHRGLAPLETHPGHGGVDAVYDELSRWLDEQIKLRDPKSSLQTATFRALPGQAHLPGGILRELEVAWAPAAL